MRDRKPTLWRVVNSRGQGLVTVIGICLMMSLVGTGAIYMSQQKERELTRAATATEGTAVNSSSLDFLASLVGAGTIRGFKTVLPVATYWTVYPFNAPIPKSSFDFLPGIVPLPTDPNTVAVANIANINDFCNPQSLRADFFGNMMNAMVVPPMCDQYGNPTGCCYRSPAGVSFLKAQSGDYLEVLAKLNGPVLPTVTNQGPPAVDDGEHYSMKARLHIPKLSDMSPPSCVLTPQYHHIWWHQYDVTVNMASFPPPDLPAATGAFAARLKFPSGPVSVAPDFRPGLINGIDTSSTNPIVFSAAATNSGGGYNFVARPNPSPSVPNITQVYNVPGEVDGPGGTGACNTQLTVQQLDKPSCNLKGPAQVWWLDCPTVTLNAPIPGQANADEAPRPPAFLTSGKVAAPAAPPGGTVNGGPFASAPLSLAGNSAGFSACANMPSNGTYDLVFTGTAHGDAGDGTACYYTMHVNQVPPPSCQLTATIQHTAGYATPTVHLHLVGSPPAGLGASTGNFLTTSWTIGGPGVTAATGSGGGAGADVDIPLPAGGLLSYNATASGKSGTASCSAGVWNNPPTCQAYTSNGNIHVNDCVTVGISTAPGPNDSGGVDLFANRSHITSPVNAGDYGYGGGATTFCPSSAGDFAVGGWVEGFNSGTNGCAATNIHVSYPPPPDCTATWVSNNPLNGSLQMMYCDTAQSFPGLLVLPAGTDNGPVTAIDLTINYAPGYPFNAPNAWNYPNKYFYPLPWENGVVTGGGEYVASGGAAGAAQYVIGVHGQGGDKQCFTPPIFTACQYPVPEFLSGTTMMVHKNNPPSCHWAAYDVKKGSVIADRGCVPGCFAPETAIRMGDGSEKAALLVAKGDWVWNPRRGIAELVTKVIAGPEKPALVDIRAGKYRVKVSSKHPMITKRGVVRADSLSTRDLILTEDARWHRVTSVSRPPVNPKQVVYNFDLAGDSDSLDDHAMIGDGVVTGDHVMQVFLEEGTPIP